MKFNDYQLNDVICAMIDNRGVTPAKKGSEWAESGYRVLSAKNVKTGRLINEDSIRFVNQELYSKWMPFDIEKNDILITSEAPCGEILLWDSDEKVVLGQRLFGIRCNPDFDPYYVYYYLIGSSFQSELSNRITGTTVQGIRQSELVKCVIRAPSYDCQRRIGLYLYTIDREIHVNNQINDNLLETLNTEYLRIKATYPSNYKLSDVCHIVNKKYDSENLTVDNYYSTENMLPEKNGVVPATTLPSDGKATSCLNGDTLVSNIRPYFKKIHYCDSISGCSPDVLCFRSDDKINAPFLFSILYSDEFFDYMIAGSKGTKMPRGDKKQIMEYPIPIPSDDHLKIFNQWGSSVLSIISKNNAINRCLINIRDYLIPKLMSGEIDLSNLPLPS